LGVQFLELIFHGGKIDGLDRAAARVILGIEVEHDPLAAEILKADLLFVSIGQAELRRIFSNGNHGSLLHIFYILYHSTGTHD